MLRFFEKPVVELKLKNPKWICGRQLTWVDISVSGLCVVTIKSASHPKWKPIKIKSSRESLASITVPIGASLIIKTWSFRGSWTATFAVANADWKILPPAVPIVDLDSTDVATPILKVWRGFVKKLEGAKLPQSQASVKKVAMQPKFVGMRVLTDKFKYQNAKSNSRSVH